MKRVDKMWRWGWRKKVISKKREERKWQRMWVSCLKKGIRGDRQPGIVWNGEQQGSTTWHDDNREKRNESWRSLVSLQKRRRRVKVHITATFDDPFRCLSDTRIFFLYYISSRCHRLCLLMPLSSESTEDVETNDNRKKTQRTKTEEEDRKDLPHLIISLSFCHIFFPV